MEWKMTLLNERNKGREEGFEQGRAEGFKEGFNDGRAEGFNDGRAEGFNDGRAEGLFDALFSLVKDGILSVKDAAERAGISEEEFKEKMSATPHA